MRNSEYVVAGGDFISEDFHDRLAGLIYPRELFTGCVFRLIIFDDANANKVFVRYKMQTAVAGPIENTIHTSTQSTLEALVRKPKKMIRERWALCEKRAIKSIKQKLQTLDYDRHVKRDERRKKTGR